MSGGGGCGGGSGGGGRAEAVADAEGAAAAAATGEAVSARVVLWGAEIMSGAVNVSGGWQGSTVEPAENVKVEIGGSNEG